MCIFKTKPFKDKLHNRYLARVSILPFLFIFSCILTTSHGLAWENSNLEINALTVHQETTSRNDVLTAGPRVTDEKISFLLRTNHIQSLEDYSRWLRQNIAYRQAGDAEHGANPQRTLIQRYGDCKNFAFLNAAVLKVAGFQPRILALFMPGKGHAICAFQAGGRYCWFDNAILEKTSAQSFPAFIAEITHRYNLVSLLELDPQNNRWEIIYRKL